MTVAYDGTDYYGWQLQSEHVTIAGMLEARFKEVFGRSIRIMGASRTDAGVHALGQAVSFSSDLIIDPERMRRAWNGCLPRDIHIRSIELLPGFYALNNVKQKIYWYHFFTSRPLPMGSRYGLFYRYPIDLEKMRAALQVFVGTHDFRAFCTDDERESTIRTVDAIDLIYIPHYQAYRVIIRGQGFLRYMIRRMVGAALHAAARPELSANDIRAALLAKDPGHQFPTAPAHGLTLRKIIYSSCSAELSLEQSSYIADLEQSSHTAHPKQNSHIAHPERSRRM
jgi:tRNA pseudouridine38-40 synthase